MVYGRDTPFLSMARAAGAEAHTQRIRNTPLQALIRELAHTTVALARILLGTPRRLIQAALHAQ
jgi:hypothetical protein